jgi:hypothetical protein
MSTSNEFDLKSATDELSKLESEQPPPAQPLSMRSFVNANADRINALVKRGWRASDALARIAHAAGISINERTLLQYLRESEKSLAKSRKKVAQ